MWNITSIYPFDVADDSICKSTRAMLSPLAGDPSRPTHTIEPFAQLFYPYHPDRAICWKSLRQEIESSGRVCDRPKSTSTRAILCYKRITMKRRFTELKLTAVSACVFLCTGCGPSNEAALKGESKVVETKPGMENVKDYGDLLKYKMQEAKEKGKGASKKTQ
jgi:hypothetical protein